MKNRQYFPEYPSNERGEIPEPMCFDVLRVFADYGGVYLWDMNGVPTMVSEITHSKPPIKMVISRLMTQPVK